MVVLRFEKCCKKQTMTNVVVDLTALIQCVKDMREEVKQLREEIKDLKRTCGRMDGHISSVEKVMDTAKAPALYLYGKYQKMVGQTAPKLPEVVFQAQQPL